MGSTDKITDSIMDGIYDRMLMSTFEESGTSPAIRAMILQNPFLKDKMQESYRIMSELMLRSDEKPGDDVVEALEQSSKIWLERVLNHRVADGYQPNYTEVIETDRLEWAQRFEALPADKKDVDGFIISMTREFNSLEQRPFIWLRCAQAAIEVNEYKSILQEHVLQYLENPESGWPEIGIPETLYRDDAKAESGGKSLLDLVLNRLFGSRDAEGDGK